MKPIHWVLISIGASVFLIAGFVFIPIIWLNQSWWWLWGLLIFEFLVWSIVGIIFLVKSFRKTTEKAERIAIDDAKKRAVFEVMNDADNPDNFKISEVIMAKEGEQGKDRTPIVWIRGEGTETSGEINVIMNLDKPKKEFLRLGSLTEEKAREIMRKLADNPEEKITSETIQSLDALGKPTVVTRVVKSTSAEKKEQEEKEKAEKINAL